MKNLKVSLVAIMLVLFASCSHDDEVQREDNAAVALKNQSANAQMPYVENGILFFNDRSHIDQYYEYLDEMIHTKQEEAINNQANATVDAILDQFESQFGGFTSFRKRYNQQYDWERRRYSKQEILSILESTVIKGMEQSYFNSDHELGIGNKVYIYHSKDIVIEVPKNRQDIIDDIKNLPKGTNTIPAVLLTGEYQEINIISDTMEMGTKMHLQVDMNLSYDSTPILENKNCDVYEKALGMTLIENILDEEDNTTSSLEYTYEFANITIDWGDGSTPTVSSYSTHSGELIWHTYTSMGTYTATVTIGFYDLNGVYQVMSDPITVIVADACTDANGTVVDSVSDSQWLLVGQLTVSNGFFGANRIEGRSDAYKKDGSSWVRANRRRHKPYLKVYVSGKFRDNNCVQKAHKEGTAQSTHANTKIKIKTKIWGRYDHSNGDVYSEHRLQKGSTYLSLDLVYNPC